MTRHRTIWWGNIRLIPCEVWMKNTALEDNAACIYLNSLSERAGDGSVIQCSLTGNTSIAAAEQMPLSLWDPAVMNCALICYNFIFLWLPAGTTHTVKWDKNNGLAKRLERITPKHMEMKNWINCTEPYRAMFERKSRVPRTEASEIHSFSVFFSFTWCVMSSHCCVTVSM